MISHIIRASTACAFATMIASCSNGNATSTLAPATQTSTNSTDQSFINGAALASNGEIGAANLALTRSTNPDVLSFANLMIKDHTTEDDDLDPIGTMLAIVPPKPPTTTPAMQSVADQLKTLTGSAFDVLYINSEIQGHMDNLNGNYMPELQTGLNVKVTGYASTFEPQIQSHLALAQSIKTKYGF